MKHTTSMLKPIKGFEGRYSVSPEGEVYSHISNKLLKQSTNNTGHSKVGLSDGGETYIKGVHALVAIAYIPNPDNLPMVGHRDDIKTDNTVGNLYWTTASENSKDAWKNGRRDKKHKKYSDDIMEKAYRAWKKSKNVTQAAKEHGMPRKTLCELVNKHKRLKLTDRIDRDIEGEVI